MTKDTPEHQKEESRPIVNSSFDEHFSGKLPSSYTEPSMNIDELIRLLVLICSRTVCLADLDADDKYEHIASFL